MDTKLKDLLEKYADTCSAVAYAKSAITVFEASFHCPAPDSISVSIKSVEKRKANLEEQLSKLFESPPRGTKFRR